VAQRNSTLVGALHVTGDGPEYEKLWIFTALGSVVDAVVGTGDAVVVVVVDSAGRVVVVVVEVAAADVVVVVDAVVVVVVVDPALCLAELQDASAMRNTAARTRRTGISGRVGASYP